MYNGKIITTRSWYDDEAFAELEREFGTPKWVSGEVLLYEFTGIRFNPIDTHIWSPGTKIILSWEAPDEQQ